MDEEIERLIVSVRADTQGFARAQRAGRLIENSLVRAIRTGKLGFEDLKRIALAAMAEIASAAIRSGIGTIFQGGGAGGLLALVGALPGRATGGPVAPGRGYVVGERGPELFVPTASGRVEPAAPGGVREVRVAIQVNAPAGSAPETLARSSRQVARAVKVALAGVE